MEIVEQPELVDDGIPLTIHILKKFLQIAVGGPVFGFIAGKITVFSLNRVFNDPTVKNRISAFFSSCPTITLRIPTKIIS